MLSAVPQESELVTLSEAPLSHPEHRPHPICVPMVHGANSLLVLVSPAVCPSGLLVDLLLQEDSLISLLRCGPPTTDPLAASVALHVSQLVPLHNRFPFSTVPKPHCCSFLGSDLSLAKLGRWRDQSLDFHISREACHSAPVAASSTKEEGHHQGSLEAPLLSSKPVPQGLLGSTDSAACQFLDAGREGLQPGQPQRT